ncbi:MAG: hypothetical protein CL624_13895 [Arcobacter sp.]|nr:hypothetical protein [Arcobacter sp.]|tara:strand:- start:3969 stop:4181 length:213 start_codon:yes stop_codon:yes gene_type:complete
MKFEWNEDKNTLNKQKHGISFEEAKEIFDDALHLSKLDNYELEDNYDFSGGTRGRFYKPKKVPTSIANEY